jgi:hypothetical protein
MKGTNWIRIPLCGFVAGVTWHLLSVVFLAYFAPGFVASVQQSAPRPAQGGAFFFAIDVMMGIWAVWLYSTISATYRTKPRAIVITGVAWWILKTLQSAKWAGLGFVELGSNLLPLGVATLGATVLASVAGAWLNSQAREESPHRVPAT